MILDKIVSHKKEEVKSAKKVMPLDILKKKAMSLGVKSAFAAGISREGHINLIAEIKKSSPSKGIIRGDFDPLMIAWEYQQSGANAISVLTDERYFDGRIEYLKLVKERVGIPVLRKDFIVDEYQIYESAVYGADAILLISGILGDAQLKDYLAVSSAVGLDVLVEVHDDEDLSKTINAGAGIIGINNRDLETFHVDIKNTERLIGSIPKAKIIVSESGIESYEQILYLKNLGVNAVLIGETFMRANEIGKKVKEVMTGAR
jgi:indole-3-glycerol phosphate synthase